MNYAMERSSKKKSERKGDPKSSTESQPLNGHARMLLSGIQADALASLANQWLDSRQKHAGMTIAQSS